MNDYMIVGMRDIEDYLADGWQVETKELSDGKTKFLVSRHKMIGFVETMLAQVEGRLRQLEGRNDYYNKDKADEDKMLCKHCEAELDDMQEVKHHMYCPICVLQDVKRDMIEHLGKFVHDQRRIF